MNARRPLPKAWDARREPGDNRIQPHERPKSCPEASSSWRSRWPSACSRCATRSAISAAPGPGLFPLLVSFAAVPDRRWSPWCVRASSSACTWTSTSRTSPSSSASLCGFAVISEHLNMIAGIVFMVFCSDLGRHLLFGGAQPQDLRRPGRRGVRVPETARPQPAALLMDVLHNLAFGFAHALTWQNLMFCAIGCTVGTLVGLLPGLGPAGHHQPAAAADLFHPHRRRAHHAGRHLLRRAVRRQRERDHDEDPARQQHRGLHRRLPDDAQGQDRPGAVHRRRLQLHRRHGGHRGAVVPGAQRWAKWPSCSARPTTAR